MVILLAGASGLLGNALSAALKERGEQVRRLVRRVPSCAEEVRWTPTVDLRDGALEDVSAVVNLGGAGIADRWWTRRRRQVLLDSRVTPTSTLSRAIASQVSGGARIRYLQASAVGWYGDGGDRELLETAPAGQTGLARLCARWEASTRSARTAGAEVLTLRTGIVLSRRGGALGPLMPLIRLGLAGPLGSGRQWWPWIHERDWVDGVLHLLDGDHVGPANLTAPTPRPNREVISALAGAVGRPSFLRVPGWALRLVMDGFGEEILRSQRAVPGVLTNTGFAFTYPDLESAAAAVMSD